LAVDLWTKEFTMILPGKRHSRWVLVVSVCVAAAGVACRETEPPRTHYADLGTDETLLLPAPSPPYALSKVTDAKAEWHAVADRGAKEEAPAADEDDEAEEGLSTAETEAEIRELIQQYNETAAEGDVEGLLEYYVPDQQDALKPLLETEVAIGKKATELSDALKAKLPDAEQQIESALGRIDGASGSVFVIESLTVVSDTEVTVQVPTSALNPTCRFVVSDDEWFIDLQSADAGTIKPGLDSVLGQLTGWLASVSSGDIPAEDVLAQIEAAQADDAEGAPAETD
jgi:hypothetical protein